MWCAGCQTGVLQPAVRWGLGHQSDDELVLVTNVQVAIGLLKASKYDSGELRLFN